MVTQDSYPRLRSPEEAKLTTREIEVLLLMAQGYTNKEIAALIRHPKPIADQTVRSYSASIFAKTGLRNRAQAGVYCYHFELIQPSS